MHSIGPCQFTETDAKRTVRLGDDVFDLYGERRDASVIERVAEAPGPSRRRDLEGDGRTPPAFVNCCPA